MRWMGLLACLPSMSMAAALMGTVVNGGGIDDLRLEIRRDQGKVETVYCLDRCGDWFDDGANESAVLKPMFKGRRAVIEATREPNRGRIAGPGEQDHLWFVRKVEWQK